MRTLSRYRVQLLAGFLALLAVGTAVNFLLIGGALDTLSKQAADGRLAHERQCEVYPIQVKLYRAAEHYRLITRHDLRTYLLSRPTGCP
jgi:hypothetical protein